MSSTIIIGESDLINSDNNYFIYNFPRSVNFNNHEIALSQCSLYYSWFNISSELGNNTFSYSWIVGTTSTTYTITIDDGMYEIDTLNSLLQYNMINNGTYLIDSNSDNVYYAEFLINNSTYKVNIVTFAVPISLPSGYSIPTNFAGYPTQTFNPVITIPAKFNKILGYTAGFVTDVNTGNNTTLTYSSTSSPDIQPNPNILVSISNIDNNYESPTGVIYSITPNATTKFGEYFTNQPSEYMFCKLINGVYNQLIVQFLKPSDRTPMKIADPNITMIFIIRERKN